MCCHGNLRVPPHAISLPRKGLNKGLLANDPEKRRPYIFLGRDGTGAGLHLDSHDTNNLSTKVTLTIVRHSCFLNHVVNVSDFTSHILIHLISEIKKKTIPS